MQNKGSIFDLQLHAIIPHICGVLTMIQGTRADVILHAHELCCIFSVPADAMT